MLRRHPFLACLQIAAFASLALACLLRGVAFADEAAPAGSTADAPERCEGGDCLDPNAASGVAPLLSYRRGADGANPLRRPAPTAAILTEPTPAAPTPAEPVIGEPSYATAAAANRQLPRFDASVQPASTAPVVPATPLVPVAAPEAEDAALPPAPVAVTDDYAAAPLPAYGAPAAAESRSITTPAPSEDAASRRLAPQSAYLGTAPAEHRAGRKPSLLPASFAQFKSLPTAGAGLAIVVGLFLLSAWALRRTAPKSSGVLPDAAFAVLGRAPLTANSFAQLLRVGNKLVLVAMSADGAQPLAEVNDPAEVDRIAGLCVAGRPGGSSAEFQQVLAQLSKEPARGFLGREGSAARRRA